jgi:hypothetical protein
MMIEDYMGVREVAIELHRRYGKSVKTWRLYEDVGLLGGDTDENGRTVFPVTRIPFIAAYYGLIEKVAS